MANSNMDEMMKKIVIILKKHPEGLTTIEISKILKKNRHTITKYIYALVGAEIITQRAVGPARLCYLKKR